MAKLSQDINRLMGELLGNEEEARIRMRTYEVLERFEGALRTVYREAAPAFLEHVNNVYIMRKDDVKTLIVYVDDSLYAAELNAQRELIKLKLLELFGEDVEKFEIYVSRGKYRKRHPYIRQGEDKPVQKVSKRLLTDEEKNRVLTTSEVIEDRRLRKVFQKAMTADLTFGNKENGKN